jgi:hypothetical protein
VDNIEQFNLAVAFLLQDLLSKFPIAAPFDFRTAGSRPEGTKHELMNGTVEWLAAEGIIRMSEPLCPKGYGPQKTYRDVVLTNRGLQLLGAAPSALKGKSSYGTQLRDAIGKGALDAAKDVAKELLKSAAIGGVAYAKMIAAGT